MRKILLILTLMLAGCASTEPTIKVVTQKVEIPIAVQCKEELPTPPNYCFSKLTEQSDIFEKTKCLLSDRYLSLGYESELVAKLIACK